MKSPTAHGLFIAVVALTPGVSGCSSPKYDVSGTVTYNGEVLRKPDGVIVFVGHKQEQTQASIGPDGTYHAIGVPAGLNKVVVYYPTPKVQPDKFALIKASKVVQANKRVFLTPEKYTSVDTSELCANVESSTVFDVDMKGPTLPRN